ncbi:MAG TPA: hypothetical protein VHW01_23590 [Polyangiaceae bacterium]|nr:hypothetical protein [Polyangiaceae bacterium]
MTNDKTAEFDAEIEAADSGLDAVNLLGGDDSAVDDVTGLGGNDEIEGSK